MTVAVKNNPETARASVFDRLPVAVVAGIVYVLASIAVVFKAIPTLFASVSYSTLALQAMVMVAVAAVLVYVGARLVGPHPARGLFPGIFVGFWLLLIVAFLASWLGFWFESLFFGGWLLGDSATTGTILAIVVGLGLLYLAAWLFLRPGLQSMLGTLDDQGWFNIRSHKRAQGLRVRRGTIVGIWLLVLCGVWVMVQRSQIIPDSDWSIELPFTGVAQVKSDLLGGVAAARTLDAKDDVVEDLGPFKKLENLAKMSADERPASPNEAGWTLPVDRYELRDFNRDFTHNYKKVSKQGGSLFAPGDVAAETVLETEEKERIRPQDLDKPQTTAPDEVGGKIDYQALTLLPHTKFTLPLLILGATMWFAWRIVNVPVFADFLIATEAELNKVSWTTRRRLIQDTIVVLITVFLMAVFLFAADAIWSASLKWIQVLKPAPQDSKEVQEAPW
jgi:preprotein translocase SecE subunit